jgi:hypothetical protein
LKFVSENTSNEEEKEMVLKHALEEMKNLYIAEFGEEDGMNRFSFLINSLVKLPELTPDQVNKMSKPADFTYKAVLAILGIATALVCGILFMSLYA